MARKEQTTADKIRQVCVSVERAARHVNEQLDSLSNLEQFLDRRVEVITMFRLNIETIRHEMKYLDSPE